MKILFFDNSTKLKTVHDLKTRARGGMVSSLFKVSGELRKKGHEVYVLSDIKESGRSEEGVTWLTSDNILTKEEWFDVLVLNRGVGDGIPEIHAKKRILWTHDLPHIGFSPEPLTMRAIDGVVFMSDYAERVWRKFYPAIGRSFKIPNGVDKELFHPREKDLNYIIYASAPNRGLKRLPLIFEAIKSRIKKPVYMKAFSNMASLHPNEVRNEEDDGFSLSYKDCQEVGIDLRNPVPQSELAEELGRAGLMILPTDYPEICSNIILQSLASGTPIITTGKVGSAGEWIKNSVNGTLTDYQPIDYMVHTVEIVRSAVDILNNEKKHCSMIREAEKTKGIYTWEEIGAQWEKMIKKLS